MRINIKKTLTGLLALFLVTSVSFASTTNQAQPASNQTIAQIVAQNPDFSTFAKALQAAGLNRVLNSKRGEYTVFAPTNEAFAQLGKDRLANLFNPANRSQLVKLLSYHVVRGDLAQGDVAHYSQLTTIEGDMIHVRHHHGHMLLNGRTHLSNTDIVARNGVIHQINHVLAPMS